MAERGTRCTTERVQIRNSLPTAARAVFLPDYSYSEFYNSFLASQAARGLLEQDVAAQIDVRQILAGQRFVLPS